MKRFFPKGCHNRGNHRGIREERSQALSELAILGALILLGFGAVLSYTQTMNTQQSLQMRAFRRALHKSRQMNKVVSYTIVKDAPTINVGDLFGRPDTSRAGGSATVSAIRRDPLFADPDDRDERSRREYYEINDQVYEIAPIKVRIEYEDDDYETWVPAPIRDVQYLTRKQRSGSLNKSENTSAVSTTRSGSVTAANTTILIMEDRAIFEQDYLDGLLDNVTQDPWERRFEMERSSLNLARYLELGLTLVLIAIIDQPGCSAFGLDITLEAALLASASLILSEVLGNFLNKSEGAGDAVNVDVIEGYRVSDSLTGTASFSSGSTFTVSP